MNRRTPREPSMQHLAIAFCLTSFAADPPKPVKIFILAGQSNREGPAVVDLDGKDDNHGKGALKALAEDPARAALVSHLVDAKGQGKLREDVRVWYRPEKRPVKAGPLAPGYTPH